MEKKSLESYTEEERQELLRHWWRYYGKMLITPEENEVFLALVKKDSKKMMDVALVSYAGDAASQVLILAMRNNALDEYFEMTEEIINSDEYRACQKIVETNFIETIVESYNHPEPDVPFTVEQIIEQLLEARSRGSALVTRRVVGELYSDALLSKDEYVEDAPTVDFVIGEGACGFVVFNAERLNKNRDSISRTFDLLLKTDQPVDVFDIGRDENGCYWTGNFEEVDSLIQLGNATGIIEFSKPRSEWGGIRPTIVRCKENDKAKQFVKKPGEYAKTVEEIKKRIH